MSDPSPAATRDALAAQIRAEAAQWPAADSLPAAAAVSVAAPASAPRQRYGLDDLVHVHSEAFVERAFRCLLKRPPDAAALLATLERLQRGDSKIAILGDLRASAEGRRQGVRVVGLAPRYAFWRATQWPLLGGLIERLVLIAALPSIAREQRRLGQLLHESDHAAAELAALRAELAALRQRLGVTE